MLYQPTFCCDCGNKIERIQWKLWTSRRFCENCETKFRKEEWLPVILPMFIALISGLFAFGSYLKTPEKPLSLVTNRIANNEIAKTQNKSNRENANTNTAKIAEQVSAVNINQNIAKNNAASAPVIVKTESLQNETEEPVYFCGAQTKKGTPCSRKVKGGGRCWQHAGQPSILPKDKLIVSH